MAISISYAITVCNEHAELNRLLSILSKYRQTDDEIIILTDDGNTTDDVVLELKKWDNIKIYSHKLNMDFAVHKNYLFSKCTKDYIFNIDADEYPSKHLISNLHNILKDNPTIDLFIVPRHNTVAGVTDEFIQKYNWSVDHMERINWPDLQSRILKNVSHIKWDGKVHEHLNGYKSFSYLPMTADFALIHPKSFDKQKYQNEFYDNIIKTNT